MNLIYGIIGALIISTVESARQIRFSSRCEQDIWISPLTTSEGTPLNDGIAHLPFGSSYTYHIPDSSWSGFFWPKSGCDVYGQNCELGQSIAPCPAVGCDPPADTKVEFFYPSSEETEDVFYNVSLVNGFSLPAEIIPTRNVGSCVPTRCPELSLDDCPTGENAPTYEAGDLRVIKDDRTIQCMSPCNKWVYPPPFGFGRPEQIEPGIYLCCPSPPISPEQCRAGIVANSQYVNLIHQQCPTAFAYPFDPQAEIHQCPYDVDFQVTICP